MWRRYLELKNTKMKKFEYNEKTMNAISLVASSYEEMNQKPIPRIIIEKVKPYIAEGMEAQVIIRAIEKALLRNASFEYAEAILKRLLEEGILTLWAWDFQVELKKRVKEECRFLSEAWEPEKVKILITIQMLKERFPEVEIKYQKFLREGLDKPFNLDEICDKD